ncbi:hypothetical protein L7F22_034973 [Adiantum nelumboides]|nr:hypothetical protein [Adiantum nelumboides]
MGANSNPSQQLSRGLGLDTLGEDQDEERRSVTTMKKKKVLNRMQINIKNCEMIVDPNLVIPMSLVVGKVENVPPALVLSGQSTNQNLKSTFTTSSSAITNQFSLFSWELGWKAGDGTVDEISRAKEERGAEVRVFETQKKGSNSKTVVRTLDFTPQDPIDVSQLRTIVEAEQELSKVMKPQEGNQIKAQVHLLPILCPALPSNLYDGDLEGDHDSESSESNDIVQGLTRQADLQTAEKEWERVLEKASLLGIYGVNHVKPFGKVMLRLEDLLDSKTPNSEWVSKLVQPSKSSSFSSSTSKVVVPQISLATSMGMVNRKSYNSSSTIKPSTASTRPPTWLSKTLTWLPTSANPISSSFSSSSSNSSGDPIKQREKERETSPTQEGVKHEAEMAAQEYLEQIDKDVAEAEKMAGQVEELDEKKGEGKIVKALNPTPTKVKSSSNVTPKKSANATLSSSPGSSRFRGSPQAKALLETFNQLRQKRQKLAQEHQRQQNRDSWVKMDFGRISGWIQSKIPGSGEDGEQRFGLATLLTFLLFVFTSVAILFSKEIASSSVFKSGRSVISTQDSSALNRLVFGTGQPVSGFQTKKKGNSITSLNRVESSALSLASSSKAKALALFESGSPSNSNVTISLTHCGKGTFEQSKELSTHLYDDFSALLKDGSQSASDWISGKVSQPKMVWNSSSKELISTSHVSKAISNLKDFTSKFLFHASKVANALLDSVRKEWEVYLQEMLRIWKIVME